MENPHTRVAVRLVVCTLMRHNPPTATPLWPHFQCRPPYLPGGLLGLTPVMQGFATALKEIKRWGQKEELNKGTSSCSKSAARQKETDTEWKGIVREKGMERSITIRVMQTSSHSWGYWFEDFCAECCGRVSVWVSEQVSDRGTLALSPGA